jgi:hypothetical protein
LPLRISDIDLLPAIRRDIHLLRVIDRDRRRITPQIAQLPQRSQEKLVLLIRHLY